MTELVIIVFALLGYWSVSWLMEQFGDKTSANSTYKETNTSHENSDSDKEQARGKYQSSNTKEKYIPDSWFLILEVSQSATKDEISKAFKTKIRQYHPDKVASLGPELQELAEFKSKEINAAYDYALKLRE